MAQVVIPDVDYGKLKTEIENQLRLVNLQAPQTLTSETFATSSAWVLQGNSSNKNLGLQYAAMNGRNPQKAPNPKCCLQSCDCQVVPSFLTKITQLLETQLVRQMKTCDKFLLASAAEFSWFT